jgi:hypothetical protein
MNVSQVCHSSTDQDGYNLVNKSHNLLTRQMVQNLIHTKWCGLNLRKCTIKKNEQGKFYRFKLYSRIPDINTFGESIYFVLPPTHNTLR